jgi:hypothetical protein
MRVQMRGLCVRVRVHVRVRVRVRVRARASVTLAARKNQANTEK